MIVPALPMLRLSSVVLLGVSALIVSYLLVRLRPVPRPALGYRAGVRREALEGSPGFRLVEPCMRWLAQLLSELARVGPLRKPMRKLAERQTVQLEQAGDYLGLGPEEYSALSVLSALGLGIAGTIISTLLHQGYLYSIPAVAFGLALPYSQVQSAAKARFKDVRRALPAAVDLASLCVSAGLDFPAALSAVVRGGNGKDPLSHELERILDGLRVGHTRREALKSFELRVPIDPVRDLVRALVQAEEKGSPVAEALAIQAKMTRMQRSIRAEEAAARAGVLLIAPMVLLLCCILLLLLGPFVVSGFGA
jgi:tight adherence protein C